MQPSYQQHTIDIPPENQIQFGLKWDFFQGMSPVDLDAQVCVFFFFVLRSFFFLHRFVNDGVCVCLCMYRRSLLTAQAR